MTFKKLHSEGTENRIAVARKRYVESVALNTTRGSRFFPTNLTAKYLLGLKERETFSAERGCRFKPPQVKILSE